MDEERFDREIRKFLKKVGITSQREIEMAVRRALEEGKISGDAILNARMHLKIDDVDLDVTIEGDIGLK